ncbi:hypothetical protein D3C71_1429580 [compost metagenome]
MGDFPYYAIQLRSELEQYYTTIYLQLFFSLSISMHNRPYRHLRLIPRVPDDHLIHILLNFPLVVDYGVSMYIKNINFPFLKKVL